MNEKDLAHHERLALEKPTESIIENLNDALTDAVDDVEIALKLMQKDRAAMLNIISRLGKVNASINTIPEHDALLKLITDAQTLHLQILGKAKR